MKVSENTSVAMPIKNMIGIIVAISRSKKQRKKKQQKKKQIKHLKMNEKQS